MKTTNKAIEALEAKGVKFDTPRLTLMKKDEHGVPQSTGKHICTILRDERRSDIRENTGSTSYKEVVGIRYWFDEGGVEKYYDVPLFTKGSTDKPHYLISRFGELNEGDKIVLESVRKGDKSYIQVDKVGTEVPTIQVDEEDTRDSTIVKGKENGEDISELPF